MRNPLLKRGLLTVFTFFTGISLFGQDACSQFSYFYSDIVGETCTLYSVELDEDAETAILSEIIYFENNNLHIAYNEEEKLIYAVDDGTQEIITVDPSTNTTVGSPRATSEDIGKITAAAFDAEGNLFLGSQDQDKIYFVENADLATDPVEVQEYSTGDDVQGGDFIFTEEGFFLASRNAGKFYSVMPGNMANNLYSGNVDSEVTGMAEHEDGGFILSPRNSSSFLRYEVNVVDETVTLNQVSYAISVDGADEGSTFVLDFGDLTSGCSEQESSGEGCNDYRFYLADSPQGSNNSEIFEAVIVNDEAVLTSLGVVDYQAHLAFDENTKLLYVVNKDNGAYQIIDVTAVSPVIGAPNPLSDPLSDASSAVISPNGDLLLGNEDSNIISVVDVMTGVNTPLAGQAITDLFGGDLVYNQEGVLLYATRLNGGKIYNVATGAEVGDVAPLTTGAALTDDGNLLISSRSFDELQLFGPEGGASLFTYNTVDVFGDPITVKSTDLAGGCISGQPNEDDCENFEIFLSANGSQGGDVFRVTLGDGVATLDPIIEGLGNPHLAYDEAFGLLYIVKGNGEVAIYDPSINLLSTFSNIAMGDMNIDQTYAAVVTTDGKLLVGSASQNKVYEVDPATGAATNPVDVPVSGGDIVQTNDGNIWLINRGQNRFYNITDGVSQFDVPELDEMYGAAVLADGSILVGDQGTQLRVVDPGTGMVTDVSYELGINITAGDLAAGCSDNNPIITPDPGDCYASEMIEYVQGVTANNGAIASNRTDASNALGEPEQVDQLVFVTLGYGGSITLGFDGLVPNGVGDDLILIETSYNTPGCASYPEYADVYVSPNGTDFFFAETICKGDNGVDISSAGDFENILLVKVVNNDDETSTPDAYDLDGVIAVYNCEGVNDEPPVEMEAEIASLSDEPTVLLSYPNPTEGATVIEFSVIESKRAVVEVFDMNGRSVATVFNQDVQEGNTYRVDFDGSSLVNGIYIIKYVTDTETIIEKLMIAR